MNIADPRVTVLIPVCNGVPYLEIALNSTLGQTLRSLRVFVYDNCSTDGTSELLRRIAAADSRVQVATHYEMVSMVDNFNACLERVQTEYFMVLCHDDYLARPYALAKACEILDAHPDVNAVYCDLVYVNPSGEKLARRSFGRTGRFDALTVGRASILAGRNLFGIPLLVRARSARDLRYDVSLPYTADVDLSIAGGSGGALYHIPEALIANRYHPGNATWSLHTGISRQMVRIAEKRSIPLSRFDLLRARVNGYAVAIAKRAFMAYVAIRS